MTDNDSASTIYIRTTPEQLWAAITTSTYTCSYFDFMEGLMAVESNWTVGAPVVDRTGDGQAQIEGRVLAAPPPRLLVTSLSLRYDPALAGERPSRPCWEITPMGEVCRPVWSSSRPGR